MTIEIGDRVAFERKDATISNHACAAFGIDFINNIAFNNCKFYKGAVTKIKTHSLLFFKLDNPVYTIDDYYIVTKVKKIDRKYASLRSVCGYLGSVWELHVN